PISSLFPYPTLFRSQTVSVTGGGASLAFTATAASTGNWLVVSPASGTTGATPATLSVSVTPASLNASSTPYTGSITVAGSGGAPDRKSTRLNSSHGS